MNSTTITRNSKPTIHAGDVAQLRALQQGHLYTVTRTETGWTVAKKDGSAEYAVTLDGRCNCPHFIERCEKKGTTCKHWAISDLSERLGLVVIPTPEAPRSYDLAELPALAPTPTPEPKGGVRWSQMSREERIRCMCGPDC